MIRIANINDAESICNIYNYYIQNTVITFEEESVSILEMEKRITAITSNLPWYVYEENEKIIGYAYAGKWKERSAYKHSVELSVYVHNEHQGKGIGKRLYEVLITELKSMKMHVIIGGMSLPNEKSQKLHESFGFEKVAQFHEVGYKFGKWIDVGYWQLINK